MSTSSYAITGIQAGKGPNGSVPLRREVDEWWFSSDRNDLYQRSLFIYALTEFMKIDPNDIKSYFAVAGIHGQPVQPWDDSGPEDPNWYCVHGNVTFPPWHRPYVALYEQRLYEIMKQIIPTTFAAQDHAALIHAADTWRLPYWDWAEKKPDWSAPNDPSKFGPNAPYIITVPQVEVLTKTGVALVDNPMWKFNLPQIHPDKPTFGHYGVKKETVVMDPNDPNDKGTLFHFDLGKASVRHPETIDPTNPNFESSWVKGDKQRHEPITKELRNGIKDGSYTTTLPESVYRLFLEEYIPNWNAFATLGYQPGQTGQTYASLEAIHGSIHVFGGGTGHMGNVGVAAFDPLFCNVDRIFALWQALYPDKYVEPYEDKVRGKVDANTPLLPFKMDTNGTPWTSVQARDHFRLGYTYPELQTWLPIYQTGGKFDKVKFEKAVRTTVELKYSSTGKYVCALPGYENIAQQVMQAVPADNLKIECFPPALVDLSNTIKEAGNVAGQVVNTLAGVAGIGVGLLTGFNATQVGAPKPPPQGQGTVPTLSWEAHDYIVNVKYDRYALGGQPFRILIFLGGVPSWDPPSGATGAAASPVIPWDQLDIQNCPNEVGLIYNFSSPAEFRGMRTSGCDACARAQEFGDLSTGQIIITDFLVNKVRSSACTLEGMGREAVSAWLRTELHWRIIDSNGRVVPRENMPQLKVSVAMGKGTHFLDACKPSVYTNYETLWEVTDGRPCGACPGDA
ncbi:hypothetical protein HYALB_00001896 [Hymenoscyphus albidus]|uniref:tyrosinase n=1 Tax=Hymenoscyphus albidus TaxID=595503 RepID=A0A9N9LFQ9_9HELO|nr:hypothetical protein HYALB_00001896 [Hymenoscyphus albidus]